MGLILVPWKFCLKMESCLKLCFYSQVALWRKGLKFFWYRGTGKYEKKWSKVVKVVTLSEEWNNLANNNSPYYFKIQQLLPGCVLIFLLLITFNSSFLLFTFIHSYHFYCLYHNNGNESRNHDVLFSNKGGFLILEVKYSILLRVRSNYQRPNFCSLEAVDLWLKVKFGWC